MQKSSFGGAVCGALVVLLCASWTEAGTTADGDGDGVTDSVDFCPTTPARAPVLLRGCAAIEAAPRIAEFSRGSRLTLDEAIAVVRDTGDLVTFAARLERSLELHGRSLALVRAGEPCKAGRSADKFLKKLAATEVAMQRKIEAIVARSARSVIEIPDDAEADTSEADRQAELLVIADAMLARAITKVAADVRETSTLCSSVRGELNEGGRVVNIDDGRRLLELDNGRLLLLAEGEQKDTIHLGSQVLVRGFDWGGSTGVAVKVSSVVQGKNKTDLLPNECLSLRIVPIQPFPPFFGAPFTLHPPGGYLGNPYGSGPDQVALMLENDMRLAVVDTDDCPLAPPALDGSRERISAQIDFVYGTSPGGNRITLAADMTADDAPVFLPANATYGGGWIVMTVRRQTCLPTLAGIAPNCEEPTEIRVEQRRVYMRDRAYYCGASYDRTSFAVEEMGPSAFGAAHVDDLILVSYQEVGPLGGGTSETAFAAEGYPVSGGVSSYPMVQDIAGEQEFAILPVSKELYDPDDAFGYAFTGVTKASGIRWPKVTGRRHGTPFWYSCALPGVGRDLIDECGSAPDSFYRFPFEGGAPTWSLSQGNFGSFTHTLNAVFAFDFVADAGTPILAARSGEVLQVEQGNTGNCFCPKPSCNPAVCKNCDPPKSANGLTVLHQDGSVGRYLHIPTNGAEVEVGDKVVRGNLLGVVGNTGCSSGPHLHFEVLSKLGSSTTRIRFESDVPGNTTCYIPDTGESVKSTNVQVP